MAPIAPFSTLVEMFERVTDSYASSARQALLYKRNGTYTGVTHRELRDWVEECANGLMALGVKKHDAVAILSENRPEWVVADMAVMKLGAVSVPVFPTLSGAQVEYILKDSRSRFIFVSSKLQLKKIQGIRANVPSLE